MAGLNLEIRFDPPLEGSPHVCPACRRYKARLELAPGQRPRAPEPCTPLVICDECGQLSILLDQGGRARRLDDAELDLALCAMPRALRRARAEKLQRSGDLEVVWAPRSPRCSRCGRRAVCRGSVGGGPQRFSCLDCCEHDSGVGACRPIVFV